MTQRTVKDQQGLNAALADKAIDLIIIKSPRGIWLTIESNGTHRATVQASDSATVEASGSATVEASGSATVEASGSATVRAWGSATVRAWDSATVRAWDSATVEAWGSATVEASGSATVEASGSATVEASGSATVRAWDSATVEASGSATVEASGSATVRAWDSATVEASGSATVEAWGSATVQAWDSATVEATPYVAVHLHSARAKVSGGVIIDITALNLTDPQIWCDYHGVTVVDGIATLYKAVGDNWSTDRGFDYSPGAKPSAPDWRPDSECGHGLHFSPRPSQSRTYYTAATRYVAVGVALADLRPISGFGAAKAKAPRVVTPCREVTLDGDPVEAAK
ncbi:MAG: hypothetical protein QM695_15980 [Micropruina sp.]